MLDEAYYNGLLRGLTKFLEESGAYFREHGGQPVAGSPADVELRQNDADLTILAGQVGSLLLELSADHISAFVKVATPPAEVFACFTTIRSMLEACAQASWLMEPNINRLERISRTFAYRFEGLEQQRKLAESAGEQALADRARKRMDSVEARAVALGFLPRRKNGRCVGIARPPIKATDLIGSVLGEEWMYRTLSGVEHAHSWAIHQLGYAKTGTEGSAYGVIFSEHEKRANIAPIILTALCGFRSFAHAVWSHCLYYGWDKVRLEEILENAADALAVSVQSRFWRS